MAKFRMRRAREIPYRAPQSQTSRARQAPSMGGIYNPNGISLPGNPASKADKFGTPTNYMGRKTPLAAQRGPTMNTGQTRNVYGQRKQPTFGNMPSGQGLASPNISWTRGQWGEADPLGLRGSQEDRMARYADARRAWNMPTYTRGYAPTALQTLPVRYPGLKQQYRQIFEPRGPYNKYGGL